jgi:hypothetical protein
MVCRPAGVPEPTQQLFGPLSRVSLFASGVSFPSRLYTSLFIPTQCCILGLCSKSHLRFIFCEIGVSYAWPEYCVPNLPIYPSHTWLYGLWAKCLQLFRRDKLLISCAGEDRLFNDPNSNSNYIRAKCYDWGIMNWKGFGRKCYCYNRGIIPAILWSGSG